MVARRTRPASRALLPTKAPFLAMAGGVLAVLPVLVATVRTFTSDWAPVGDVALVDIRARDVLTARPPLLGTWTTASLNADEYFNHPGPLQFDLLALPARLVPGRAGTVLGMGLVNALAVLGICFLAARRGGPLLALAGAAVSAGFTWAMGSSVLAEPWPIHSAMLPFLAFLLLVWCLTCGDLLMLPWAVAAGSLVLQTHLSYALLVPAMGVWGVFGLALVLRSSRTREPDRWPDLRRRALRIVALSGVVLIACWAQPLAEQIGGHGTGNLTLLVQSFDDPAETLGLEKGARVTAEVVALPPWFLRPSFRETLRFVRPGGFRLPSTGLAIGSLVLLGLVLGGCARVARRGQDRESVAAVATAAVAVVVALATAMRAPLGVFGIAQNQFRWLWPLTAFVAFAILAAGTSRLRTARPPPRPVLIGLVLLAAVPALLNVPASDQGASAPAWSIQIAHSVARQLRALEGEGPLLVEGGSVGFVGPAVMAELRRRDNPFLVDDPVLVRQLGRGRELRGRDVRAALTIVQGEEGRRAHPEAAVVAHHELALEEQRELDGLEALVRDHLRRVDEFRLNAEGQAAHRQLLLPELRTATDGAAIENPERLLTSGELVALVNEDLLDLREPWRRRFERYAVLEQRRRDETVAVLLRPLSRR